jgi:ankyrin repeat protein
VEVVKALLGAGADANVANIRDGSTALLYASQRVHTDDDASSTAYAVVKELLDAGARANDANMDGWTALFYASQHGHTQALNALLWTGGADANAANNAGSTALMCAAQQGRAGAVRRYSGKGRTPALWTWTGTPRCFMRHEQTTPR